MNDYNSQHLMPALAPQNCLCFSEHAQRWMIEAPHNRVLLDPLSLDILLACDGQHSLGWIAQTLDRTLHTLDRPPLDVTVEIVRRFLRLGVLQAWQSQIFISVIILFFG